MTKKITLFLFILVVIACKKANSAESTKKEKIKASQWLLGTWENQSSEGCLKEIWTEANDSTFEGKSYFIKEKDTIHFQTTQLQQIEDDFSYTTTIFGENNDKPVLYSLKSMTEKELIFENLHQDYPQKISYTHNNNQSFDLHITGKQLKKPSQEHYLMKKVK